MVATSLTSALDSLGREDYEPGLVKLSDMLAALGFVLWQILTEKRRSLLKAKLLEDYKSLTSDKFTQNGHGRRTR